MGFDLSNTWDSIKDGIAETAEVAHEKTNEFHEQYVSKITPDCGKYGDAAKFAVEMIPGVSEYNAIKDGDWQAFAIAAGIDIAAVAIGAFTAGAGYAAVKSGTTVAKTGVKVAVKEVAEAGAEKIAKEVVEAGVEKLAKETVEAGVEKVVKETVEAGVEKVAKETVEAGVEKVAKETVEAGVEKVAKETVETGVEKVAKETVEAGAEKVARETVETGTEKAVKETAEKATKESIESSTETVSKEAVERLKEGGSYRDVKKLCDGTTHEVHHMPAKSTSFLDEFDGPAIKMDKFDHQKTASWGNSIEAKEYRKVQQELVENGNFRKALEMDIEDIASKFADKYDNAIQEMLEYVNKLELEGIL